ncbi:MAG TPA: hypothetical protein VF422_06915, partial [Dokdonella sp.]
QQGLTGDTGMQRWPAALAGAAAGCVPFACGACAAIHFGPSNVHVRVIEAVMTGVLVAGPAPRHRGCGRRSTSLAARGTRTGTYKPLTQSGVMPTRS